MDKSLSGNEIIMSIKGPLPRMISYDKLHEYGTINELLGDSKKCVLLYLTSHNHGHWCCIYEHRGIIYFFDSYGFVPDEQLKFVPKHISLKLNGRHRYLTQMLLESGKPVQYNEYELQSEDPRIATCGRWCIVRLNYPDISVNDFKDIFTNKKLSPDKIICELTKEA